MNHVVDLLDDEKKETLLEESVIVEVPTEDRDSRPTKTRRDGEMAQKVIDGANDTQHMHLILRWFKIRREIVFEANMPMITISRRK